MLTLIQFPSMWHLPNPSPFCMKIETYLRMTGIPFDITPKFNPRKGPKGKFPYIIDNGHDVADSSLIIDYLKKNYGDKLDSRLTDIQRAQAICLQRLLEEHLYWITVYSRWIDPAYWPITKEKFFGKLPLISRLIVPNAVQKRLRRTLYAQGIGRHSREEIYQFGIADLKAVSTLLNNQLFILGNEPTSIDACAYAFIASILIPPIESPLKQYAQSQQNLVDYCARMKERYYK